MDDIFGDLVRLGKVIVYIDDILVFTNTLEEHQVIVKEVLQRLREHRLYLKPSKSRFEVTEVEFLGLIVGNGQVRMDPAKVKAISNWPTPTNL